MRDVSKWDAGHQLPNVKPIQLDVSSDASVEQAISKIVEEDGKNNRLIDWMIVLVITLFGSRHDRYCCQQCWIRSCWHR